MCLDILWTRQKTKEWLKTQPDPVIAYKVVSLRNGRAHPPVYFEYGPYGKTNKVEGSRRISTVTVLGKGKKTRRNYTCLYHLFHTEEDAKSWIISGPRTVLKCKIPKKAIADVGHQGNRIAIIAKEFTFAGNKYLKDESKNEKEKQCA